MQSDAQPEMQSDARSSMQSDARPAARSDAPRVAELLGGAGIIVDPASLQRRIGGDPGGGVVVSGAGCLSWALDGGAVHLYDVVAAEAPAAVALLREANAIAREQFAAVLTATLYGDDPVLGVLLACGFEIDWDEPDVRRGEPTRLVGLVREVS